MPDDRKPAQRGPAPVAEPTPQQEEELFEKSREEFFNSRISTAEVRRAIVASIHITDQELLEALSRRGLGSMAAMAEKK